MKFTYTLAVSAVLILLLSSCEKEDNPVSPTDTGEKDNNGVWYLKRNATFKYSLSTYDTSNTKISTNTVVNTINNDSLIDNVKWYKISDSPIYYYRNKSDGLYRIEVRGGVVTGPYLLFKFPTSLNDKYLSNGDSVVVDYYDPSSFTNEVTIIYIFSNNGIKKSIQRITTGSCPSVINMYGTTQSGREYVMSSMLLQEANWP